MISPAKKAEFGLCLRIPVWTRSARIFVNELEWEGYLKPESYHLVQREWSPGDTVRLELEMRSEIIESHPMIEETRNQLAIKRGPLVYCLETRDLPPGISLADVYLDPATQLVPGIDSQLHTMLPGIQVLMGSVLIDENTQNWQDQLYRPTIPFPKYREVQTRFIPYFAWDNRGPTEMTVWIPRAWK